MVKLPKQWKHWCYKLGLRPESGKRYISSTLGVMYNKSHYCYLVGRGRRFRVNMWNVLEVGSTYEDFDRWANSVVERYSMPTNFNEFKKIVKGYV